MPNKTNHARQFMPFNALKGYYLLVEKEWNNAVKEEYVRHDSVEELAFKLSQLQPGMMVSITYLRDGEIFCLEGMVSKIDNTFHKIQIVKKEVDTDSIISISGEKIHDLEAD